MKRDVLNAVRERRVGRARATPRSESGRVGWVLLWALGVPIPVLLILYFVRGCT